MEKNNLFKYATKELSQDAMLCWIANWYNFKSPLSELSKKFINLIMNKHGYPDFALGSVRVFRQYGHIDVLIVANDETAIIIEDKTFTSEHGNQLSRYRECILNDGVESDGMHLNISEVVCVYLKTAEYIYADKKMLDDDKIVKITRADMLSLIQPYTNESEILCDYFLNLKELDDSYAETEQNFRTFNYDEALKYSYMQWKLFREEFPGNPEEGFFETERSSSLSPQTEQIQQGTTFGSPYTWYWFLEYSDRNSTNTRYLGYRIDNDCNGAFVALRMYCRYDKNNVTEKENQIKECQKLKKAISEIINRLCTGELSSFDFRFNPKESISNYECEILKLYFNKNVFDEKSKKLFGKFLRIISNNLELFYR